MPANQPTIDVNEADRATLLRVLPYSVVERVLATHLRAAKVFFYFFGVAFFLDCSHAFFSMGVCTSFLYGVGDLLTRLA